MYRPTQMVITYLIIGLWVATLSAPVGWILGARIGDERGVIGYLSASLAIAAGIAAAIGL